MKKVNIPIVSTVNETVKMEASTKREWFHLDKPVGEPVVAAKWAQDGYSIERVVKADGEIVWFGQGTNWVSKDGGKTWKYLGTDYSVKPLEEGGCIYSEERSIWIDCEPPIYEVLYKDLVSSTKNAQRLSGDGVFFHCGTCKFQPEEGDLLKMNYCPNCGCKFETGKSEPKTDQGELSNMLELFDRQPEELRNSFTTIISYDLIHRKELEFERKNLDSCLNIIRMIRGEEFLEEVKTCLEESDYTHSYEFVDTYTGELTDDFYYCDQTENGGITGDSFAGFIYIPIVENKMLFKFRYEM